MKVIIDRIEGKVAVCEKADKSMIDIEVDQLPKHVKAGDVVIFEEGRSYIDLEGTKKRKKYIQDLTNDMWE
ncbi:hypothetical protein DFP93_105186 [Aneurinibacillus soli]|uniref:Uncharacterized protein n=1 Tax=Aneurinibacillus soli TaxID=1500254 RepID=A0A0U5BAD7_9BACL|nr:DUF3006 domain-containing protein [Aneurinibacillus soli]PYE62229.1 hypothetical protein DFP93_105186 [Aneurinibacillus soli]BAU28582.1 hypothetical protein CB4_02757 [Aneurinibacillus soli]